MWSFGTCWARLKKLHQQCTRARNPTGVIKYSPSVNTTPSKASSAAQSRRLLSCRATSGRCSVQETRLSVNLLETTRRRAFLKGGNMLKQALPWEELLGCCLLFACTFQTLTICATLLFSSLFVYEYRASHSMIQKEPKCPALRHEALRTTERAVCFCGSPGPGIGREGAPLPITSIQLIHPRHSFTVGSAENTARRKD